MEHAGDTIGRYRLLRQLGAGGMGTVWLASRSDGFFDREVALKLLHTGLGSGEPEGRFQREREILGSLNHPGIAAILDAGQMEGGRPFFAMEAVRGEPIDRYCAENAPSLAARLRLLRDAAAAVGYAHERHVIHRDLKPANLLVTEDGQIKLIDFGIARWSERALGRDAFVTQGPLRFLTPDFAAPEQLAGGKTSAATDVYALAKVANTILSEAERHGDLAAVLDAALRPIPEERYPDARALAADLENVIAGEPVRIREISRWSRARRWLWLQRDLVIGIGAAVAILVATLMVASARYGRAQAALAVAQEEREATQERGEEIEAHLRQLGGTGVAGLGQDATPEIARQLMIEEMIHLARRYKTPTFMLSTARSAIELAEFLSADARRDQRSSVRRLAQDARDLLRRLGERHPDAAQEARADLDQLSRRVDDLMAGGS